MQHSTDDQDRKLSTLLVGVTIAFTFVTMTIGYYLPPERGEVGVIFPPWTSQADAAAAIIEAGGSITGNGRFSNIWVAFAPDAEFSARVRQQGAVMLTSARGLCGPIIGEVA